MKQASVMLQSIHTRAVSSEKSAFEYVQNAQIQIIIHMRKVSSGFAPHSYIL